jgi:hypothetical protein
VLGGVKAASGNWKHYCAFGPAHAGVLSTTIGEVAGGP